MPAPAQTELETIAGRELKVHWKSPRFGEWLAWCYVPAANLLHSDGAGFEARAPTVDEARAELRRKVEAYLAGQAGK